MPADSQCHDKTRFGLLKELQKSLSIFLEKWRDAQRMRRIRTHLSELPPHLLRDIGLSEEVNVPKRKESRWLDDLDIQSK